METTEIKQNEVVNAPQPLAEIVELAAETDVAATEVSEDAAQAPVADDAANDDDAADKAQAAPVESLSAQEVERLVAEAYRRGRNESIAELMARPSMFESEAPKSAHDAAKRHDFLARQRPSIWDL